MTEQQYKKISKPFRKSQSLQKGLKIANKVAVCFMACVYGMSLLRAFQCGLFEAAAAVMIPGIWFVLLSAFRSWYSAKRPYEVWNIRPLLEKDTKGKSFPSRHVFSAFMIASVCITYMPYVGMAAMVVAGILAWIRVIAGVHFTKDVLAGAVVGIGGWFLGYGILQYL